MKPLKLTILSTMLIVAGMWSFGSGVYIHCKAWLAQQLIASAWQRTLSGEREVRPWPWADTWPIARLRTADGIIDLYVLADASGRSLAFGPGQVSGTAPIGKAGDTLIAGHRDTHFKFLRTLPIGAELILQTEDGNDHRYRVVEEFVFDTRNERLASVPAVSTLTLLTCYPFDAVIPGGPLRYAAIATLL
jgi:sortase A